MFGLNESYLVILTGENVSPFLVFFIYNMVTSWNNWKSFLIIYSFLIFRDIVFFNCSSTLTTKQRRLLRKAAHSTALKNRRQIHLCLKQLAVTRYTVNFCVYYFKVFQQYETIMQGGPQTNNMLESYNRMIDSIVGAKTNVWDFLKLVISHGKQTHNVSFCLTLSVRTSVETQAGSRRPWTTFKW